jgi:hypothetical protein
MPDRRAGPPSLVGELRLVNHPGRVVGKICTKIREAYQAESESKKKKYPVQPAFYWPRTCRHAPAPNLSGNGYLLNIEAAHPIEIRWNSDLPLHEAKASHLCRIRHFDSSYFNQGFSAPRDNERLPFGTLVDQLRKLLLGFIDSTIRMSFFIDKFFPCSA